MIQLLLFILNYSGFLISSDLKSLGRWFESNQTHQIKQYKCQLFKCPLCAKSGHSNAFENSYSLVI